MLVVRYGTRDINNLARPPDDLLCVEWDVKPYTRTHCQGQRQSEARGHSSKYNWFIHKMLQMPSQ